MTIEVAAYEAITHLRYAVPYASERGYCYILSCAELGGEASFPGTRSERNPMLIRLVQYVIAQERLTQHVMDFLQNFAIQTPQIPNGEPLRIDPVGRILRVLQPLAPEDEVDIPLPGIFPHDR